MGGGPPSAGWYRHRDDPTLARYWDGNHPLSAPAEVRWRLPPQISQKQLVFVALKGDGPEDDWEPLATRIDQGDAVASAPHFSSIGLFEWLNDTVAGPINDHLTKYVLRFGGLRATPPRCGTPPEGIAIDRAQDETIDPLLGCVEARNSDGLRAMLVNNRGYATVVQLPPGATIAARSSGGLFDRLMNASGVAGQRASYIVSGGSLTVDFLTRPPSDIDFVSSPSLLTMAVDLATPYVSVLLGKIPAASDDKLILDAGDCLSRQIGDPQSPKTQTSGSRASDQHVFRLQPLHNCTVSVSRTDA
ncbi:MAG: hypothetical protein M3256_22690, partial [Actinomycetota bacterium]|nr:hypothetical protein [Actinomycetota bacterium]